MNYGIFLLLFMGFSSLDFELWDFLPSVYGIFSLEFWGALEMSTRGGGPT